MELQGQVAVITGAASGLGRAIALRYAHAGADIAIADLNDTGAEETAEQVRKIGTKALTKVTDVADYDQVAALMAEVVKTFGRIDILVSNAGIGGAGHLVDLSKEVFECVVKVHLFGAFYCSQLAAREMIKRKYGRIILMSSITALQGPIGTNLPYGAAKTVNAIAPGPTDTPMLRAGSPDMSLRSHHVPMGRVGNVTDIANAAWFFALPSSGYVTGTVLPVDGGAIAGGCYMVEYHRNRSQSK
jgi:3-oxoacyl-[acyl-carrier protein] reductase